GQEVDPGPLPHAQCLDDARGQDPLEAGAQLPGTLAEPGQELLGDRATSPATDQLLDRLGFRLADVGASTLEHRPGDGVDVPPGDRLVVDDGDGGTHVTVDHGGGVLEEVQVVAPPLGEGHHQGGA